MQQYQRIPAGAGSTKAGWRVREWAADCGVSRSLVYNLLSAGKLRSVKIGRSRIIITPVSEYLASLAREAA